MCGPSPCYQRFVYVQVSDADGVDVVVDCARRRLGDVPPLDALVGPRQAGDPRDRLGLDLKSNRIWRLPPGRADAGATVHGLRRVDLSSNSSVERGGRTFQTDIAEKATAQFWDAETRVSSSENECSS